MTNLPAAPTSATFVPGSTSSGRARPPQYPTRFVGRREEVVALRALLQPGRLVTAVALGGAGKTRLAAETVGDQECVWVDLSAVTSPSDVASRVAEALDLPAAGGADSTVGIVNALRDRPRLLLVLDNCEVQPVACRHLVDSLMVELEASIVLATSRMPLNSAYEWLYLMPPLAEGTELFVDRAARVGSAPLAHEADDVTELCRRVGGLPLAIELLAAWSHVLSPSELLQSQPEMVSSRTPTVLPRHQDMTAVLNASIAMLTFDQQQVLAALGVFAGGFTTEAAEAVAVTDLDTLASLVERGLISRYPAAGGRFGVHDLVQSHALARLRSSGEESEAAVRRRHFAYFVALAEPWADTALTPVEPHLTHPLAAENANLDAARRWALEQGDARGALRLMQALDLFWAYAIPPKPRRLDRLAPVLALPYDRTDHDALVDRAWACHTAGQLTMKEPDRAREWFEESRQLFRVLGHEGGEATALRGLMEASLRLSELETAEAYNAENLAIVRRIGDHQGEAWTIYQDAMLALARGQTDRAEACALEARNAFGDNRADYGIMSADCLLGDALYAQGRYSEAVAAYGAAVAIQTRNGFVRDVENILEGLAIVAAAIGAHEFAARFFGAAATWRAISADLRVPYGVADYRAAAVTSRRSLGRRRWQTGFDAGTRLTSRQAMEFAAAALGELGVRATAAALGLTARERQVLRLVADGSHDHEVAERLGLSRRTVHAHLRSVYAKLDVTTRTAAAHRAAELGLLNVTAD